jgi:hypothetical protein
MGIEYGNEKLSIEVRNHGDEIFMILLHSLLILSTRTSGVSKVTNMMVYASNLT